MFSRAQNTFVCFEMLVVCELVFFFVCMLVWEIWFYCFSWRTAAKASLFFGTEIFPLLPFFFFTVTNKNRKPNNEEETKRNFVFDCLHVLKPIELCDGGQQIKPILDLWETNREECWENVEILLNVKFWKFVYYSFCVFVCTCGCFNWVIHLLAFFFCLYLLDSVACFDN